MFSCPESGSCGTAQSSITKLTPTSITASVFPTNGCTSFEQGSMWLTLTYVKTFNQTGIFSLNPASFTIENLVPDSAYTIVANPYYANTANAGCARVRFEFQTPSLDSNLNLAYLSLLAIIPIFAFLLLCIFLILLCVVVAVVVAKRKKSTKKSTILVQKGTEPSHELVEEKNELQNTLKEQLGKQYILDYNKIKFATEILGSGAQGTVYKGTYLMTDVAIKLLSTQSFGTSTDLTDFYNEAKLLAEHSNHPNIVKFIGVAHNPQTNQVALITELCTMGSVAHVIEKQPLSMLQRSKILFGVASGMSHLHLANIIHRDLKAENILLDGAYNAKIIDFGFSKQIQDMNKTMNMTMNVGTASYVAPEVIKTMQGPIIPVAVTKRSNKSQNQESMTSDIQSSTFTPEGQSNSISGESDTTETSRKKRQYDMKADVYSFAIIMWVLYHENRFPYGREASDYQIIYSLATNPDFRPSICEDIPSEEQWYIDLMKECWATNPDSRPSFEDVSLRLQHQVENQLKK